ncbi:type I-F CRISPR-associated protein Csy2 [Acinetobacter baumannii]
MISDAYTLGTGELLDVKQWVENSLQKAKEFFNASFLLIPHLKLHNANAMSSPYTIGFPAMTAWLGAVHALQRKLQTKDCDVALTKVAVSCHEFNLQTYKGQGTLFIRL